MADTDATFDQGDDQQRLRRALESAEVPPLIAAVAQLTGDHSVLRDDYRPDPSQLLLPTAGIPDGAQAEARAAAFDLLTAAASGAPAAPDSTEAELVDMLSYLVGTEDQMDDYLPLFREELGGAGNDLRSPDWSFDELVAAGADTDYSVAVIGAGMSGILAAHRLRQAGVPFVVLDKNDDVGGTWLENSYPGCRVDIPNHFYSYSFDQREDWPQHYSSQDVLLDYFRSAADRFGIRDDIRFGVEVIDAVYDDRHCVWELRLRTDDGEERLTANAVISAVGQLNRPLIPDIDGLDSFAGPMFHSARWDHDVDVAGKRVVVIGSGASALQLIPVVAEEAGHVSVLQRTPAYLFPTPDYHDDVDPDLLWLMERFPLYAHWLRFWLFWRNAEGMRPLVAVDPDWDGENSVSALNEVMRQTLLDYLREQFGDDPELLEVLTPGYAPAAKRIIRDNGIWARTLKRDDVDLVTTDIDRIDATGVVFVDGTRIDADVIVLATGFTAADFLTPMKIVGRNGVDLHEHWAGDAHAYLGITVPGFPNLFCLYGPNTNIVINGSIIYFSECEVTYVLDAIGRTLAEGIGAIDCRPEVHDDYNEWVDEGNRACSWGVATVNSWYRNAAGRSAQNWPYSLLEFWQRTRRVDLDDYELLTAD